MWIGSYVKPKITLKADVKHNFVAPNTLRQAILWILCRETWLLLWLIFRLHIITAYIYYYEDDKIKIEPYSHFGIKHFLIHLIILLFANDFFSILYNQDAETGGPLQVGTIEKEIKLSFVGILWLLCWSVNHC